MTHAALGESVYCHKKETRIQNQFEILQIFIFYTIV